VTSTQLQTVKSHYEKSQYVTTAGISALNDRPQTSWFMRPSLAGLERLVAG